MNRPSYLSEHHETWIDDSTGDVRMKYGRTDINITELAKAACAFPSTPIAFSRQNENIQNSLILDTIERIKNPTNPMFGFGYDHIVTVVDSHMKEITDGKWEVPIIKADKKEVPKQVTTEVKKEDKKDEGKPFKFNR